MQKWTLNTGESYLVEIHPRSNTVRSACSLDSIDGQSDPGGHMSDADADRLNALDFNGQVSQKQDWPLAVNYTANKVLDYKPPLRSVKVFYSNGDNVTTDMAAGLSDEQIRSYYAIGREFNIGNGPDDEMATVTGINILK